MRREETIFEVGGRMTPHRGMVHAKLKPSLLEERVERSNVDLPCRLQAQIPRRRSAK
jgi:hypothetical protein